MTHPQSLTAIQAPLRTFKCALCHKPRPHAGSHLRRVLDIRRLVCWRHPRVGAR